MSTSLLRTVRGSLSASVIRKSCMRTGRVALFSTSSGDDAKKPTALAKLHLEDGTTLTGRSFGCHEAVEGEVRAASLYASIVPAKVDDWLNLRFLLVVISTFTRSSSPLVWSVTPKV